VFYYGHCGHYGQGKQTGIGGVPIARCSTSLQVCTPIIIMKKSG
jgi:hypothetical protein